MRQETSSQYLEFALGRGLVCTDFPSCDVGHEIILAFHRYPGHPPQHRELSDVRQRVGDRTLKQLLQWGLQRLARAQVIVEGLQSGKEARLFLLPREWSGIIPLPPSIRHGKPPVHQVADVSQDLSR